MSYLEDFLNRNQEKPFVTNLKKYVQLNEFGKLKCISSFFTHVIVDAEQGIDNKDIQEDLLSIMNQFVLYKNDIFFSWLEDKIK